MNKRNLVLVALYDLDSFPVRTLHAALRRAGFDVTSIFFKRLNPNNTMDPPTSDEVHALVGRIRELEPVFVGISVRSTHFKLACKITEEIKREADTLVVWGGIHPTIRPTHSIESADVICVGEGEEAVVELATRLAKGEEIDNIQNLWIHKGDRIIRNDLRPLIHDLDSIPFPDFSNEEKLLVEEGDVRPLPDPEQKISYWLMTSRGCPFSCTYCCNSTLRQRYRGKGMYVRRRSVENVVKELACARRRFKHLTSVAFLDDVFAFDVNWIKNFCDQYKKTVNMPFFCYCHPRATDKETIRLLKGAGAINMTMGIQTGSEEIRHKYFERYDTNEDIIRAGRILRHYEINCAYDVIMDNPLETEEDRRETFNLLLELPRPFELHTHTLTHFPETKLTRLFLEKRIISADDVEDQKQESYERWTPALDLRRDEENLFWDNLYYLAKNKYVPQRFLVWLSHIRLLRKHPKPLTRLLRLTSANVHTMVRGSRMDAIRRYVMLFRRPHLLFEKRAWLLLWTRIRQKLTPRRLRGLLRGLLSIVDGAAKSLIGWRL